MLSRAPGGDATSLRCVRKCPQSVRGVSDLCGTCVGLAGDENRREMQNCRHFLVPECVTEGFPFYGWGPEGQEATRGRCVMFASVRRLPQASASVRKRSQSVRVVSDLCRTCVGLAKDENRREMRNCRHSLVFVLQKFQQSGGSWSRNPERSSLLDSSRFFASQKCQPSQGLWGSWSRNPDLSSLLDSSRVVASQKCQPSQGSGGSSSRNLGLSSLLESPRVFASQKCQPSQGSGGSSSRNLGLSSLLDSSRVVA